MFLSKRLCSAQQRDRLIASQLYSKGLLSSDDQLAGKAELLVLAKEGSDDGSVTNAYTNTCRMMNCKFF